MAEVIGHHTIEIDYTTRIDYDAEYDKGIEELQGIIASYNHVGQTVGGIIKFPVADNYAVYAVIKEKPLQLIHIDVGDGYQIPDAHVRGLNLDDIKELVAHEKSMNELFGG